MRHVRERHPQRPRHRPHRHILVVDRLLQRLDALKPRLRNRRLAALVERERLSPLEQPDPLQRRDRQENHLVLVHPHLLQQLRNRRAGRIERRLQVRRVLRRHLVQLVHAHNEVLRAQHTRQRDVLSSKNFIVCVNKLDEVAAKNSSDLKTTFDAACAAVAKLLKKVGVDKDKVIFLPISALQGVGLFEGGETFPFYEGCKPAVAKPGFECIKTLEEAINYQDVPVRPVTRPLRMPLSNVAHVAGHGAIFCGRIDYGSLKKGDLVKFLPTNLKTDVKNVQEHRKDIAVGEAGMNVGFSINCKDKIQIDKIKTGHIVGPADDNEFAFYPFYVANCFSLKPKSKGGEERGIRPGYTPVLSGGTANVACKFVKILGCVTKTGPVEDPAFVPNGARFSVLLYPSKPVLFETADKLPFLGKFVCRDSGIIVAAGQITERLTEDEAVAKYGVNMADVLGQKPVAAAGKAKKK
uniref:GTP-eEF1A C-terminal domain-containing protein n=1 Tax=Homalodisca liturata TaxID=320908 RepID=A0A1B6JTY0_9HEMI